MARERFLFCSFNFTSQIHDRKRFPNTWDGLKLRFRVSDSILGIFYFTDKILQSQCRVCSTSLESIFWEGLNSFILKGLNWSHWLYKRINDSTDQFRTQLIYRKSSYSREIKKSLNFKDFKKRTQMLGFGSRVKARI